VRLEHLQASTEETREQPCENHHVEPVQQIPHQILNIATLKKVLMPEHIPHLDECPRV
jgi:hypothetical protein